MTITGIEAVTLAAIITAAFGALYLHARRECNRRQNAARPERDADQ